MKIEPTIDYVKRYSDDCLNPYSNGMKIELIRELLIADGIIVLILILME